MVKYFIKAKLSELDEDGFTGFTQTAQHIIELGEEDIENMQTLAEYIKLLSMVHPPEDYYVEILMITKLEV